jgi:hypothetical protein
MIPDHKINEAMDAAIYVDIWRSILGERLRQDERREAGDFKFTLNMDGLNDFERLACLTEELGEIAKCVLMSGISGNLAKEIVQIAALSVAWLERFAVANPRPFK